MDKKTQEKLREQFRLWSIRVAGGCNVQAGINGKSWPCGSCFNYGLGLLIDEGAKNFRKHNEPVNRINEVWRFVLQIRDEKYR